MMDIVNYILEIIKFMVIYIVGFSMKPIKDYKRNAAILCIIAIMGLLKNKGIIDRIYPVAYFVFILTVLFLTFGKFGVKKIIVVLWSIGVVLAVDTISYVIVRLVSNGMNLRLSVNQNMYVNIITIIILVLIFGYISYYGRTRLNELSSGYFIVFLAICVLNAVVLSILDYNLKGALGEYAGVYLFLVLGSLIQMAFVLALASSNIWHRKNEELKEKYLELQTEHYRYLEERNQDTKKFRHDIRAHMHIMKKYIYEEKWKELDSYIDTIYGKLENISGYISVKNETVDAIINYYNNFFVKKNITFKVSGSMPQECHINAIDLCTVFSNILSNALENTNEKEDEAELFIHFDDGMIYIRQQNTFSGKLKMKGKEIITTKSEEWLHGFGIQNIKDSVRKYSGNVDIEVKDNHFVIDIIMENKEACEKGQNRKGNIK